MADENEIAETSDTPELIDVTFIGAEADQPIRGNLNGSPYEYPLNEPVQVPADIMAVIHDAGYSYKINGSLPEPEGEGAALTDVAETTTDTGDGGTLDAGGSGSTVNPPDEGETEAAAEPQTEAAAEAEAEPEGEGAAADEAQPDTTQP
jgi:hypothetical protein